MADLGGEALEAGAGQGDRLHGPFNTIRAWAKASLAGYAKLDNVVFGPGAPSYRMCSTCVMVGGMPKMIQIRDVPDDVHRTLKMRAASAGMSLSDYVKRDLEAASALPTLEEIDARVSARGSSSVRAATIVSALRDVRDA